MHLNAANLKFRVQEQQKAVYSSAQRREGMRNVPVRNNRDEWKENLAKEKCALIAQQHVRAYIQKLQ